MTSRRAGQRGQAACTGAAYWGSVIARRASEWPRMYSISSVVETGLVGTMTIPVLAAASQKKRNSGQLPRWRLNLSPCRRPRARSRCAARFTASSNWRQVHGPCCPPAASSPTVLSKDRNGVSGKRRALSSSALFRVRLHVMSMGPLVFLLLRDEGRDAGARALVAPERRRVGLGRVAGLSGADVRHD